MSKARAYFEEELKNIIPLSEEESRSLLLDYQGGNEAAFTRLIEGNLFRVMDAVLYFSAEDADYMDLVQEGNLALVSCLSDFNGDPERFSEVLTSAIHDGMFRYMEEEKQNTRIKEEFLAKINTVDLLSREIAEKTGEAATAEQLASIMQIPEDEVDYLLRVALSAVKKEQL